MNEEPSVLDFVKALLTPWRGAPPRIPSIPPDSVYDVIQKGDELVSGVQCVGSVSDQIDLSEIKDKATLHSNQAALPWRTCLVFVFAIIGQSFIEPPNRNVIISIISYILSLCFMGWAFLSKEWKISPIHEDAPALTWRFRGVFLIVCLFLMVIAFLTFKDNLFTPLNLFLWGLAIIFGLMSFWLPENSINANKQKIIGFISRPSWNITISKWILLIFISTLIVIFFRFSHFGQIPNEMFSDHAEKLQDVEEVLSGEYSIFFPRNTGREAIQMYLTAFIGIVLGTGLSFESLKIGTVLAGLFTLPFIYFLGKELGNKWVGLLAFILAGIAYWPNVISRMGLRFPLYPLFVAPALFYLIRGLKKSRVNDLILVGIVVGVGLHGYSPYRIMPLAIILAFLFYLLHRTSKGNRIQAIWGLFIIGFFAFILFLPLFRYWLENPDMFAFRALSRVWNTERSLPGSAVAIFLNNYWRASIMYFWDNGNIWVHSVTGRPALDIISAALYFIGTIYIFVRYLRYRNWVDIFLIISVPVLMLPSILSLAYPDENPALNRASGAMVPVFLIIGIGMEGLFTNLRQRFGKILISILGFVIIFWSASQNYDLVFNQFYTQFRGGAWNTSDIGHVIRSYADSIGSSSSAYVIPYPHWVDTRLVGINAGYGPRDFAIPQERLSETVGLSGPKLFIVNTADIPTIDILKQLFPSGEQKIFDSPLEGKDFIMYYVQESTSKR